MVSAFQEKLLQERAKAIVLYATNTGELYPKHCEMAKTALPLAKWKAHIVATVIPMFNKEEHTEVHDRVSVAVRAAPALRAYYSEHVKELEAATNG